jgi:hypothetical protein
MTYTLHYPPQSPLIKGGRIWTGSLPFTTTEYTQVLENAKGFYTGPPGPPILGGNDQRLRISPPRIGGLGGLMQGFNVFFRLVCTP